MYNLQLQSDKVNVVKFKWLHKYNVTYGEVALT